MVYLILSGKNWDIVPLENKQLVFLLIIKHKQLPIMAERKKIH
jgi:3-dehydroquinate synthase class II